MRKSRRPDLAAVWLAASVGHQVNPEFSLGRFHGSIGFPLWYAIAFGIELEMVNQRLHRALHDLPLGRSDLGVAGDHLALRHPLHALTHNAERLAHLFHAHK